MPLEGCVVRNANATTSKHLVQPGSGLADQQPDAAILIRTEGARELVRLPLNASIFSAQIVQPTGANETHDLAHSIDRLRQAQQLLWAAIYSVLNNTPTTSYVVLVPESSDLEFEAKAFEAISAESQSHDDRITALDALDVDLWTFVREAE